VVTQVTDSGVIEFTDVDFTDTHTVSVDDNDTDYLGSLTATIADDTTGDQGGNIVWDFAVDNTDIVNLGAGEQLNQDYTVTVADGKGGTAQEVVSITLNGANDAASINGISNGSVTEDSTFNTQGTLTVTDVDQNQAHTKTISNQVGVYGSFSVDENGNWIYNLDNASVAVQSLIAGQVDTETFVVSSLDGTATQEVTVTINGTNDVPIFGATDVTGGVTELLTATGDLTDTGTISFTDADITDTHTTSVKAAGTTTPLGELTSMVNTTNGTIDWSYSVAASAVEYLAAAEIKIEQFTITLDDGNGGQVERTVSVSITGTNDVPVITSGVQAGAVVEDSTLTASGQITSSDVDNGATATYTGDETGTYGSFAVNATTGAWTYVLDNAATNVQTLAAGEEHTESFVVQVTDGLGGVADETVNVLVTGTNDASGPPVDIEDVSTGFESGFDGWQTIGSTSIVNSNDGSGNMAQMSGTGASETAIEEFFGDDIPNSYQGTYGSAIKTTLSLEAGDTISFDYYFNTSDYLPYNDFSVFMGVDGNMELLSNVAMVGDYGESEWQTMELTIVDTGIYDIGFASINAIDTVLHSQLWVDNLQIAPSTNDTGGEAFNGTTGNDIIVGSESDDILTGLGGDDTLTGGFGADTFFFNPEGGDDTITDFGTGDDVIDLSAFTGMGYDNVILNSTQTEDGVNIDLGNGNSVTLVGVSLDSLDAGDFAFG
jgi:VCBS repeat-containing protein